MIISEVQWFLYLVSSTKVVISQFEMYKIVIGQFEAYNIVFSQFEMYKIVIGQFEMYKIVIGQFEMYKKLNIHSENYKEDYWISVPVWYLLPHWCIDNALYISFILNKPS